MPSDPTIRPRSRAGYMAPQRRSWKGLLSDRLTQKTMPAATMTGGVGNTKSGSSEAAPRTRIAAIWRAERGPTRPANAPRRLAMNGAAARAASPMGSRPPRRAMVGSSDTTKAKTHARADRADHVEGEVSPGLAPTGGWTERGPGHHVPRIARVACEVSCRARRSDRRRWCDSPRKGGSPVLDEEVRPGAIVAAGGDSRPWSLRQGRRPDRRWWPKRRCGCSIPHPSRCLDLWGCVVSTGPGNRGTRAEDATGPRKSGGKKKYLATASRLSLSLLRQ